jgi:hypothetical protein
MNYSKEEKTSLDIISGYFQGKEIELTEKQMEIANRIDYADNIIRTYPDRKKCIKMIQAKFPDISQATAYRIYSAAKYVFGSVNKFDKNYERQLLYEKQMKLVNILWASNPVKYAKHINTALIQAAKILGLDKPDDNAVNPQDLIQHNYLMLLQIGESMAPALIGLPGLEKLSPEKKAQLLNAYREISDEKRFDEIFENES